LDENGCGWGGVGRGISYGLPRLSPGPVIGARRRGRGRGGLHANRTCRKFEGRYAPGFDLKAAVLFLKHGRRLQSPFDDPIVKSGNVCRTIFLAVAGKHVIFDHRRVLIASSAVGFRLL
jgi:hypothetical protein